MWLYSIYTVVLSVLPWTFHEVSWIYLAVALLSGAWLLRLAWRLYRPVMAGQVATRKMAVPLYLYSMLYLAVLFLAGAVDRVLLV